MKACKQLMALCGMTLTILASACKKDSGTDSGGNGNDQLPQISAFSPATGATDTVVTITGNYFSSDKQAITVKFGSVAATDIVSATITEIKVKVPKAALPGKVKLSVNIAGKEGISTGDFTIEPATWKKLFGGTNADQAKAILRATDGGYVMAGNTLSNNSGDVGMNKGDDDVWIIKTDGDGNRQWSKTYGGKDSDYARAITGTSDGGFIVAGSTNSNNSGDVGLNHGDFDMWILKLDAGGNLLWQKTFGGSDYDYAVSVISTADGGFIAAGGTSSNKSGDVGSTYGNRDMWIVKFDAGGKLMWQKTFGGTNTDYANAITSSADGGFVVAGGTYSNNSYDVGLNHGLLDMWVVKLDVNGNLLWQKTLGGNDEDNALCITHSAGGGFAIAGSTKSNNDGDVGLNHGVRDLWVANLDGNGKLLWQKTIGGSGYDLPHAITNSFGGGFVVAGSTDSNKSGDIGTNHGGKDMWIVKLSANGTLAGQQLLGGNDYEEASSIATVPGDGYVIAGYTDSNNNGDVGANNGISDMWVVKIKEL
jgi:hypothetical protein